MEVLSHGLNCYDGYDNIYFSAALNREPRHLGMLRNLGFDLSYSMKPRPMRSFIKR